MLRKKRFEMEDKMVRENKRGKRNRKGNGAVVSSVWWQQKRRREENMWHNEEVGRLGDEIKKREREELLSEYNQFGVKISAKSNYAMGGSVEEQQKWFPANVSEDFRFMGGVLG